MRPLRQVELLPVRLSFDVTGIDVIEPVKILLSDRHTTAYRTIHMIGKRLQVLQNPHFFVLLLVA